MSGLEIFSLVLHFLGILVCVLAFYYFFKSNYLLSRFPKAFLAISISFFILFLSRIVYLLTFIFDDTTGFIIYIFLPALWLFVPLFFLYAFHLTSANASTKSLQVTKLSFRHPYKLHFTLVLSVVVFSLGALGILGNIYHVSLFTSITPYFPTMKIVTAMVFVLCSLVLRSFCCMFSGNSLAKRVFASFLLVISLILLITPYLFSNVSAFLPSFPSQEVINSTIVPSRPSLGTIFGLLFFIFAGLYSLYGGIIPRRTFIVSGIGMIAVSFIALMGYLFNAPLLYYNIPNVGGGMAVITMFNLACLGSGLLLLASLGRRGS
jgi:hypothetical protein